MANGCEVLKRAKNGNHRKGYMSKGVRVRKGKMIRKGYRLERAIEYITGYGMERV